MYKVFWLINKHFIIWFSIKELLAHLLLCILTADSCCALSQRIVATFVVSPLFLHLFVVF